MSLTTLVGGYCRQAGVIIFCVAGLTNFVRLFSSGSVMRNLELMIIEPLIPAHFVLAVAAIGLLVRRSHNSGGRILMVVIGLLMVLLSIWSLYELRQFAESSVFPLRRSVWVIEYSFLIGGILVLGGSVLEMKGTTSYWDTGNLHSGN